MAYLSRIGYVDVIITEDSDLLSFGAKKVFYKMDGSGNGKEIDIEDIKTIRGDVPTEAWTQNLFLEACIFAGCDYLSSIKGIGFKKAYKLMGDLKNYKSVREYEEERIIKLIGIETFEIGRKARCPTRL